MGRMSKKDVETMIDNAVSVAVDEVLLNLSESMNSLIDGTVDKISDDLVSMIRRENIRQKDPKGIYKKTELLLYAYPKLINAVQEKQEQVQELQIYGVRKRSGSITSMGSGSPDLRSEMEKVEDAVEKVQKEMEETIHWISKLENALEKICEDPYYFIISDHYFSGKTYLAIAKESGSTEEVIRKQKNRLVKTLETKLFISEYVDNLMIQINLFGTEDFFLNC